MPAAVRACAFAVLACLLLLPCLVAAESPPRELLLAGGALAVCSDLGVRSCTSAPQDAARRPAQFRLDAAGIDRALAPGLMPEGAPPLDERRAMLQQAHAALGDDAAEAATVEDALAASATWGRLLDRERVAVLSALELPQVGADGQRSTERAFPELSREPGGVAVLRAFVDAARLRSGGRAPRIAVVTASAGDPMEPVDFHLSTFRALGAEAIWWPIDPALAKARFDEGDCARLPAFRESVLGLSQRERIYPDLAEFQRAYCDSQPALMLLVQGVFFAGGDQWKIHQSLYGSDGLPNAWLAELQAAQRSGRVVVGGTSAGSAVQSGAWMLTNGDVEAAVSRPARRHAPPEPGCGRAERCVGGVAEDTLTLWPGGGLGLADAAIVDTHFSERARELRLLMAMQAADARWGYGADETSALRVRDYADRREIEALGESGGWVFRRAAGARDEVEAWYLTPGATLVVEGSADPTGAERVRLVIAEDAERPRRVRMPIPDSAFESGALRAVAQRLGWRCGAGYQLPAAPGKATLRCAEGARGWRGSNGLNGVGPLRLRFARP